MHVEEQIESDVAVVSLKGDFLGNDDEFELREKITSLKSDGITKVVVDLGRVTRINSRGLSALVSAVKEMRTAGGDVRMARIDRHLNDILGKTRLVQVFDTFETVGRALASFAD